MQIEQTNKCKDCNCNCHCITKEHSDLYGVCSCEKCGCKGRAEDESFENNGVVIDDTIECEGCQ